MQDKYLPDVTERIRTVREQINESKRIIYRNLLELPIFKANGNRGEIAQVEFNNNSLKEKIDILQKELDSLEQET